MPNTQHLVPNTFQQPQHPRDGQPASIACSVLGKPAGQPATMLLTCWGPVKEETKPLRTSSAIAQENTKGLLETSTWFTRFFKTTSLAWNERSKAGFAHKLRGTALQVADCVLLAAQLAPRDGQWMACTALGLPFSLVASTEGHISTAVPSTACHVGTTLLMARAFLSLAPGGTGRAGLKPKNWHFTKPSPKISIALSKTSAECECKQLIYSVSTSSWQTDGFLTKRCFGFHHS